LIPILCGCLDQKQRHLEVEYTMGRDLAPGTINAVLAVLRTRVPARIVTAAADSAWP
jgi:hypothetical protein